MGTNETLVFVTKNRFSALLKRGRRSISRAPDAILETANGKRMPIFRVEPSAIAEFQRLKTELFGSEAGTPET
jgi:hypothetical protein